MPFVLLRDYYRRVYGTWRHDTNAYTPVATNGDNWVLAQSMLPMLVTPRSLAYARALRMKDTQRG